MLARHAGTPANVSQRSSAMRRQRRRSTTNRLYCSTNGCASFLEVDPRTNVAVCPICGLRRRLH